MICANAVKSIAKFGLNFLELLTSSPAKVCLVSEKPHKAISV